LTAFEAAAVNPFLYGDVRLGFELQVAFMGVLAVVVLERPLDVHGMRVVSLNQVRVVAVHRTGQAGKRGQQGRGQTAAEAGGFLGEVECQVGERPPVPGAVPNEQRFHDGDQLASICRFDVRFHGRSLFVTTICISCRCYTGKAAIGR
jgi:hypothetical protein